MQKSRSPPSVDLHQEMSPEDTAQTIVQKVFRTSIQAPQEALAVLDIAAVERAATLIHASRQRDVCGLGGCAQIACDVAHKFLRIGIRASVFDDTPMMAMPANLPPQGDRAIAFSHSGMDAIFVRVAQKGYARAARNLALTVAAAQAKRK